MTWLGLGWVDLVVECRVYGLRVLRVWEGLVYLLLDRKSPMINAGKGKEDASEVGGGGESGK